METDGGERDDVLSAVEDSVVLADEGVSQDPERDAIGSLNGNLALTLLDTDDVGGGLEGEGGAVLVELDVDGGQLVEVGAISVDVTDHGKEGVGLSSRTDHEGGSSVDDGSAQEAEHAGATRGVVSVDGDGVEAKLPVGLRHDGDVLEGTRVVARVNTTEGDGRSRASGSRVEVDGEEVLLDQALAPHQIEGRSDIIGSNRGVGKTEDTVHGLTVEEGSQRSRLTEGSLVHSQTGNSEVIDIQDTVHASSAIADLNGVTVGSVGRRKTRVVLILTRAAAVLARHTRDPQVAVLPQNTQFHNRKTPC